MNLLVTQEWYCPNCKVETQTRGKARVSHWHRCARLRGLGHVPFLPKGIAGKVEAHEREDYLGANPLVPEIRTLRGRGIHTGRMVPAIPLDENGRPVMSIVTTRDNGRDTNVLAPTATAKGSM